MTTPLRLSQVAAGLLLLSLFGCGSSGARDAGGGLDGSLPIDSSIAADGGVGADAATSDGAAVDAAAPSHDSGGGGAPHDASSDGSALLDAGPSGKKGVGVGSSGDAGEPQLEALGVFWYYDWGTAPVSGISVPFIPLIFSPADVGKAVSGPIVLGFNEPDNASQSNVSVDAALAAWPEVVAKSPTVGAPAMAGNPVTGTWLPEFMDAGPVVSFIPIHWYKGVDSSLFISDVTAVINTYHLPVWVTEFAPQDDSESTSNPAAYTQAQVNAFITATVSWMEQNAMVERYAWHSSTTGTSALYAGDGGLTETGLAYAGAH